MSGALITLEGVEGSGKSTQAEMLGQALASRDAVVVREPGGTELGEKMREVLLFGGMDIDAEAEMYLFMAARSQFHPQLRGHHARAAVSWVTGDSDLHFDPGEIPGCSSKGRRCDGRPA